MASDSIQTVVTTWYPIAAGTDLPYRHTYHGQLLGRELAVWRADDDYVNVWENRCLHRGVRLSIGINDGAELRCQYHGWRYANRTAGCTYIPAHPADAPARAICNRTYPAVERYGLVFSTLDGPTEPPVVDAFDEREPFPLRGVEVCAPAELVREALRTHEFQPNDRIEGNGAHTTVVVADGEALVVTSVDGDSATSAAFFVQPVDAMACVIRGVLDTEPAPAQRSSVLRHHNALLCRLRDDVEVLAGRLPAPEPIEDVFEDAPTSPSITDVAMPRRAPTLRVQVARKWSVGQDIAGFELEPLGAQLPTFQPGAHIDVHLPNGLVRQYSLINAPGELQTYTIGVKREPNSRGGSECLHDTVREGDVLAISEPRNNFPLRRDAVRTLLIAGGIGVTPLLSMARVLHHGQLPYELHVFAQSSDHVAFGEVMAGLEGSVITHLGLTPEETIVEIGDVLGPHAEANHAYICGPGPMLDAGRRVAADAGWPDEAVHFEYFANTTTIDHTSSFEVALARSAMTLPVAAGETILDVLRANGVDVPSSCEQGACGTCAVAVLEGRPDHQDVYLNESERRAGTRMMTCVSRANSARLVLDI